ncbi:MAG: hypothetical protein QXE66_00380 [Desulfurococcaceae archaeon]
MQNPLKMLSTGALLTILMILLTYAALNYGVVLSTYAKYWSIRSPVGPLDDRQYKPAIILSVSETPECIKVRLMRTYAKPGFLKLTIVARLFTREGGIAILAATIQAPVGTLQELIFQGGMHEPLECVEISVTVDSTEVDKWSSCIRS